MPFFRQTGPYVFSAVAGLATGAGLYLLYFRLSQELAEIRTLIAELKRDIAENNACNRRKRSNRSRTAGYYSVTASSGDEDEDFVDALAGDGDLEIMGRQNGQASLERYVQFASPVSVEVNEEENEEENEEDFLKQIDDFIAAGGKEDYDSAFSLLRQKEKKMKLRAEYQWRLSKVTYFVANAAGDLGDPERKKELMYQAKDAALIAVNLDPNGPHGHKWYAITLGCIGDYEPTAEKIKNAIVIKKHIETAIELNPNDPTPHHMLGRWCYSVYMLSWLERKAAAAFFGSPPTSTVEEALDQFMQAENLNPGKWKENSLYIGKCLIERRQYDEAVKWLRLAQAGEEETEVDSDIQNEVKALLEKYGR